jgi:hypothetical protein
MEKNSTQPHLAARDARELMDRWTHFKDPL